MSFLESVIAPAWQTQNHKSLAYFFHLPVINSLYVIVKGKQIAITRKISSWVFINPLKRRRDSALHRDLFIGNLDLSLGLVVQTGAELNNLTPL